MAGFEPGSSGEGSNPASNCAPTTAQPYHFLCKDISTKSMSKFFKQTNIDIGSGGGQVVSMLPFYSDDSSSNPAEVYSVKLCEINDNKRKRWPNLRQTFE